MTVSEILQALSGLWRSCDIGHSCKPERALRRGRIFENPEDERKEAGEIMQPDVCRKCREEWKCKIKWGLRCNRNGGKKIPRFRRYRKEERGLYVVTAGPGEEIRVMKNSWRGSAIDHSL